MRIVGGELKGQRLSCPKGRKIRPTTDRIKEALFQILESSYGISWRHAQVMDLFAGTGSLGIEALSRGADHVLFVERDRHSVAILAKNLERCALKERAKLVRMDVLRFLAKRIGQMSHLPFSLIFADPPYGTGLSERVLKGISAREDIIEDRGLLVVEEGKRTELHRVIEGDALDLRLTSRRVYGDTALFFYQADIHS